ncbi:site-specific integrase [Brevibacillus porteri]|uniref:Site-specific integrase n=1 Tax=Brevibacillus porteri TaxID=2126350 RepID=A0ABX5FTH9_9BACL|nr:site-specific integrase [Brevibacillus porteri]MED1801836.1 site-specific integrase [Brevibacillus porteri]MED2134968.1 site-specific integrase [Brevibacillus porteri]MED2745489.1 site-specific integrase [Brevibacillus porteri]MED2815765.1 site-specific integrase [Brevibacillus porteri]MED2897603.1 site-specific integrase [Brevibacillus porteri]
MASFRKIGGKWEYRIRFKDPFTQKHKEKSKRGFATKKEAQLAAAEDENKLLEFHEQSEIPLKSFLQIWLDEYKKDTIRKNTYLLHQRNIQNHILPYFDNIMLQDVKPIMYQKFLNHLTEKDYSKRSIEIVHTTMFNAMEKAVTLGKIEKNPCIGVTIKGQSKQEGIKFMESSDIPRFLQATLQYDYIYWMFFKVLIETGMRKGEAAALQWTDIDFKQFTISINKTLDFQAKSKDEFFGDTKTFNSNRTVKISQSLINDLKHHLSYQNKNKLGFGELYHHDINLVLCRKDGNFIPKSSLFNAFSRTLKKVNIPSMPIHSLRHTHAVLLMETGADMKYIQERLGHGSMQITADVYAHVSKKIESDNMKKFEDHMQKIYE